MKYIKTILLNYPWPSLLLCLFTTSYFCYFLPQLEFDPRIRIWFKETDPNIEKLDSFEKKFGSDEAVIIIIKNPKKESLFDYESIADIKTLTEGLWNINDVIRVESLTNFNDVKSINDDISISSLTDENHWKTFSQNQWAKIKAEILNHPIIPGLFVNREGNTAILYGKFRPRFNDIPRFDQIMKNIDELVRPYRKKGYDIHLLGSAPLNNAFKVVSKSDLTKAIPSLIIVIIILLTLVFKRLSAVLIPMIVIVSSIGFSLGAGALFEIKFNNLLGMLPIILIAISIADSIHIFEAFNRYYNKSHDKKWALEECISKNLVPTFITTFTTCIGFFSLTTTDLIPIRSLGLLAGLGTIWAWIITFFFAIPLLHLLPIKIGHKRKEISFKSTNISIFNFIKRNSLFIISIFTVCSVISLILSTKIQVNTDPYSYFTDNIPIKIANDLVLNELNGVTGPEIIIDSGIPDGIKDPVFLNKVDKLKDFILKNFKVNKVTSIIDNIKLINKAFNGNKSEYFKIPDSKKVIAELLFFYSLGLPQGQDLNNKISIDNKSIRLSVLWAVKDSKTSLANIKKIEQKAHDLDLKIHVTGKYVLFQKINFYVVETFFLSMLMALFLITIVMIVIFKSFKIGLLSMIPNIIPLTFAGGLMSILNKDFEIGTVLIASVCLGIVVDDTVHFISGLNKYMKEEGDIEKALIKVIDHTMPALTITSILLIMGFGRFLITDFVPNINFGLISCLVIFIALLCDLLLLPSIVLILKKK